MKNKKETQKLTNGALKAHLLRTCERLRRDKERFKTLDKEKSEFIAIASHRLRNPLACIRWSLEMLLASDANRNLTAKQKNFLQEIYKNDQILIELVDNLLRAYKLERGKTNISAEPVSIEGLINETIKKLSDKMDKKGVKIIWTKIPKPDPKLRVDSEKIKRVLKNILDNAIIYNYTGGKIEIALELMAKKIQNKTKKYLKCSIFNTGVGIPREQLKNIFTKFFRANNVITVHTEGNGLDLFIAKSYVQNHQGQIWAESEGEGMGATINFILPMFK